MISRSHWATGTFATVVLQTPQPTRLHWLANIFFAGFDAMSAKNKKPVPVSAKYE
jgi:hypothetical protein